MTRLRDGPAVRPSGVLHRRALRVGRQRQHEDAAAVRRAVSNIGAQRADPEDRDSR